MQASRAVSGAKVEGIDLEASGQLAPGWNLSASYTHFTARDADGKPINTSHPRSLFKLYTTYRLPGDLHRLTVGGGVDWQSRMYQSAASPRGNVDVEQGSYALVNVMARFDFSKQVSATLNVNNLFDRKYYDQIGFYSQGWWRAAQRHADAARAILIEGAARQDAFFFPSMEAGAATRRGGLPVRARAGRLRPAGRRRDRHL